MASRQRPDGSVKKTPARGRNDVRPMQQGRLDEGEEEDWNDGRVGDIRARRTIGRLQLSRLAGRALADVARLGM